MMGFEPMQREMTYDFDMCVVLLLQSAFAIQNRIVCPHIITYSCKLSCYFRTLFVLIWFDDASIVRKLRSRGFPPT